MPGFGYLERLGVVRSMLSTAVVDEEEEQELELPAAVQEEEDPSSLPCLVGAEPSTSITVNQWICLSPTYNVPTLYFTAHTPCPFRPRPSLCLLGARNLTCSSFSSAGAPLTLPQLLQSSIFHPHSPSTYPYWTLSALHSISTALPFISQGSHPTTGAATWFLHPCETEAVMRDVLSSFSSAAEAEEVEGWRGRWLESWLMVVGSVVNMRV